MDKPTVEQIDQLLPQTQCGLCSYGACKPYAEAIVNQGEAINRCPPGGDKTLLALAKLLHQSITDAQIAEAIAKTKTPQLAIIDEKQCIGCTKCLQACPVDAIVGSAKQMHTVLAFECTGCGLCVEPCPVDCIDMRDISNTNYHPIRARQRYTARQQRKKQASPEKASLLQQGLTITSEAPINKKAAILAAVARAKSKKMKFK